MGQIKFSHIYEKMKLPFDKPKELLKEAVLLDCVIRNFSELGKDFVEYDTKYFDEKINGYNYYPLPKGKLIILLLDSDGCLWTTIRRWTSTKHKYYLANRGRMFEIVVEEKV